MNGPVTRQEALKRLRRALEEPKPEFTQMIKAGPGVRARFQPIFQPSNLPKLTEEDFRSFLLHRNNRHWVGLHRKGPEICSDMKRLRQALAVLLDEGRPIEQRLDDLQSDGPAAVPGMGRGILTAILLVVFPDRYGVWNNRSQGSMEELGLWPDFDRGESFGSRYRKVNAVLLGLARELDVDLWTLDGLWWAVLHIDGGEAAGESRGALPTVEDAEETAARFGLERHLQEFLVDNWDEISLGRDWDLHTEDGEVVGFEYPTPIGRIDLLARHKTKPSWLVVELKRGQSSDDTVGQTLRYMGYVREHVAGANERVEGLIIAHEGDEQLRYALKVVAGVNLMLYDVEFHLREPESKESAP